MGKRQAMFFVILVAMITAPLVFASSPKIMRAPSPPSHPTSLYYRVLWTQPVPYQTGGIIRYSSSSGWGVRMAINSIALFSRTGVKWSRWYWPEFWMNGVDMSRDGVWVVVGAKYGLYLLKRRGAALTIIDSNNTWGVSRYDVAISSAGRWVFAVTENPDGQYSVDLFENNGTNLIFRDSKHISTQRPKIVARGKWVLAKWGYTLSLLKRVGASLSIVGSYAGHRFSYAALIENTSSEVLIGASDGGKFYLFNNTDSSINLLAQAGYHDAYAVAMTEVNGSFYMAGQAADDMIFLFDVTSKSLNRVYTVSNPYRYGHFSVSGSPGWLMFSGDLLLARYVGPQWSTGPILFELRDPGTPRPTLKLMWYWGERPWYGYNPISLYIDGGVIVLDSWDTLSLVKAKGFRGGEYLYTVGAGHFYDQVVGVARSYSGDVIVRSIDNLTVLSSSGAVRWERDLEAGFLLSADIWGRWVATDNGSEVLFYRVSDGRLMWSFDTGQEVSDIAVSGSGSYVYVAAVQSNLTLANVTVYMLTRNGAVRWSRTFLSQLPQEPYRPRVATTAFGEKVLVGSGDWVRCLSWGGRTIWSHSEPNTTVADVAIDYAGRRAVAMVNYPYRPGHLGYTVLKLYNAYTGTLLAYREIKPAPFSGLAYQGVDIALRRDGGYLAVTYGFEHPGSWLYSVGVFRLTSSSIQMVWQRPVGGFYSRLDRFITLSISPGARRIAVGTIYSASVYDLDNGNVKYGFIRWAETGWSWPLVTALDARGNLVVGAGAEVYSISR